MVLNPTPALLYSLGAAFTVVILTFPLLNAVCASNATQRRSWLAFVTLFVGGAGAVVVALSLADAFTLALGRRFHGEWVPCGVLLALSAFFAVPLWAAATEESLRVDHPELHAFAASPAWLLACAYGIFAAVTASGLASWLVLAPVLCIPKVMGRELPVRGLRNRIEHREAIGRIERPASYEGSVEFEEMLPASPASIGVELGAVRAGEAHCPVCRHRIEEVVHACAKCRTPHHAECFDFNGRCAIYGCESSRAVHATALSAA